MKRFLFAATLAAAAAAAPALAADVGVSISVGEPGFYGQINIGNVPPPLLIYPQPIIIQPAGVAGRPIYLHVPPGHAKNWRKHCRKYNACGRPVYFVQDRWYNEVYVPRYRDAHRGERGERHGGKEKGHGKGHGKHRTEN